MSRSITLNSIYKFIYTIEFVLQKEEKTKKRAATICEQQAEHFSLDYAQQSSNIAANTVYVVRIKHAKKKREKECIRTEKCREMKKWNGKKIEGKQAEFLFSFVIWTKCASQSTREINLREVIHPKTITVTCLKRVRVPEGTEREWERVNEWDDTSLNWWFGRVIRLLFICIDRFWWNSNHSNQHTHTNANIYLFASLNWFKWMRFVGARLTNTYYITVINIMCIDYSWYVRWYYMRAALFTVHVEYRERNHLFRSIKKSLNNNISQRQYIWIE